ncbi:MAG: 4Fe-4S binding protein, partial [Anaerolineae bacterium]|nr:4Fe-4S binding protein [Anaerolineae bacterium]
MSVNLDKNGEAASRRKRLSLWIKGRKVVQTLALVFFCILLILSRSGQNSVGWIDLVFRFDPLLTLTSMLASRTFLLEASIGLALALLLAVVAGRAWCGWLCPLGTLLDWFNFKKKPALALPEGLRGVKYGLLLVILFAALMGNLSLLLLDPLTIVYRSFTFSLLPALDQLISALEKSLYPIEFFQPAISWLEGLLRPAILPDAPQYFNRSLLFGLVFAGVLLL